MSTRERSWPVPVALVALSAIPLVMHILGATTYALGGMLRFVPGFRRRHPAWHRRVGRVLVVAGLLVVISALWMTLFYEAQPGTGDLLYVLRLVFASAMAACLVLGLAAVRRGEIATHRAWMLRACAIGLAAAEWALRRPARRRLALSTDPQHARALS